MIPLKWRFYRALNYLLFCCGIILSLYFLGLIINATDLEFLNLSILFSLLFLFMTSHGLINIIIMSKTFPDKILSQNKNRWYIFSLILNLISLAGLIIIFFASINEMNKDYFTGLLIMFTTVSILMFSSMFVLLCQFSLRKYLRQKNAGLMNSLIDSIGNKTENSE
jgi:hypothetical protein